MANLKPIYDETKKNEGEWQQYASDSGNYCDGKLIGTMRGISAIGFKGHYGYCPTVERLKQVTPDEAYKIYKASYWDSVRGDEIENQNIARIVFGMYIGSPSQAIAVLEKTLKNEYGVSWNFSGKFSKKDVEIINQYASKRFFEALKKEVLRRISLSEKKEFIRGWSGKYERMVYDSSGEKSTSNTKRIVIVVIVIVAVGLLIYYRKPILSIIKNVF